MRQELHRDRHLCERSPVAVTRVRQRAVQVPQGIVDWGDRRRDLIVAPKIIRDSVWKPYVDLNNLAGWVDVISYDGLMRDDVQDNEKGSGKHGLRIIND